MDQTTPVYDSITIGALRMARRHWYVVVAAAAVGLLAGFLLNNSATTWSTESSVRILFDTVTSAATAESADRTTVDPLAIARRVSDSTDTLSLPDSVAVDTTGDLTAGSVTVNVSAPTEAEAVAATDAMTELTKSVVVTEAGATTTTKIAALQLTRDAAAARLTAADERLAALQAAGQTPGPTDPAVLERLAAADALAAVESDLQLAESQLAAISENVVSITTGTAAPEESSPLLPIALMVLAAGAALLVLLLVQALDGRIRRRLQVERSSPRCRVVGVLPRTPDPGDLAVLHQSVRRFVDDAGVTRLLVMGLKGDPDTSVLDQLGELPGCTTEVIDRHSADVPLGRDGVGLLLTVPFGAVSEDVLLAAVADATTAGTDELAALLTRVPRADLAWASVSVA